MGRIFHYRMVSATATQDLVQIITKFLTVQSPQESPSKALAAPDATYFGVLVETGALSHRIFSEWFELQYM